ncbi:MAG: 30S ribosomal protein S12 methylthiotransferase RimO [Bacteroidales bacterium]|nr:30S ribosomal protein S12 methylthiotransferase RimO [Bacteroidales bacterium]MDD4031192.1 30S ribosomal protein S12 methylthiotransferase RimO [Bacteroidales bacterium]MDD4435625.1 30S ribosomal protein S12 methylthiotransferase RimO [Bacteroidales bacterium]
MPQRVSVYTLGCSKNRVDSEHLMRQLQAGGCQVIPDATTEDFPLDALVINTCGFIHDAKEESINYILESIQAKEEGRLGEVLVMGCLSERYKKELEKEMPSVDAFFGVTDIPLIAAHLGVPYDPALVTERVLSTPAHYAYLKLSEGCDRSCAYCAIPLIRGPHRSRPMKELLAEAGHLALQGVRELNLVAQDTSFYGLDLNGKRELATLMEGLCLIDGIDRIRLLYTYPQGFPLDVLRLMAREPKICQYVDIPLQHISDKVLKAMRRNTTKAETLRLIEDFRTFVPGLCLRTTLMVGHPGEDEQAFQELLDFVKEARFERMGAFTYSREEGTYGAKHLKDHVPAGIKRERYERLMELQKGNSLAYNRSRVGSVCSVLADYLVIPEGRTRKPTVLGRTQYEAPEVDGYVILENAAGIKPGSIVKARITKADEYDLHAQLIDQ